MSLSTILGDAWVQLAMWLAAGGLIFHFSRRMKGGSGAWKLIAVGVLLIGIRIGYKLLPFYKATLFLEATRYLIGLVGIIVLFVGIAMYCDNLRPLYRGGR